ncbi:hypothetical protein [Nocardiopsis sp. NRRL B-16309]|uniref:hypothetical protein n=1 Tax=Nocardiopsis sp. NRRL B-16309 TaxID=1519494 RepID=UPI0006AE2EA3|nr:hypothetical protein [Nocardiopsis sp. NRRL B-16309]KOX24253.1 hypothetical protein ADL05_01540 [Nocardiopsis sp. NRRL B-16309]
MTRKTTTTARTGGTALAAAFALTCGLLGTAAPAAAQAPAPQDAECLGGPLHGVVMSYCVGLLPAGRTADWLDDTRRFDTGQLQGAKRVYAFDDGTNLRVTAYEDGVVDLTPENIAQGDERFDGAEEIHDAKGRPGLLGDGAVLIRLDPQETPSEEGPFTVEVSTYFTSSIEAEELIEIAGYVTAAR